MSKKDSAQSTAVKLAFRLWIALFLAVPFVFALPHMISISHGSDALITYSLASICFVLISYCFLAGSPLERPQLYNRGTLASALLLLVSVFYFMEAHTSAPNGVWQIMILTIDFALVVAVISVVTRLVRRVVMSRSDAGARNGARRIAS